MKNKLFIYNGNGTDEMSCEDTAVFFTLYGQHIFDSTPTIEYTSLVCNPFPEFDSKNDHATLVIAGGNAFLMSIS
jgi:hypothetical protein